MSITHHIADIRDEATRNVAGIVERAAIFALDKIEDHRYAAAQKRGREVARKMRADGALEARSGHRVIHLPK